ncbi:MAG TPA: hypothetical protein VMM12_17245 [Longimicrobiales bacterium]|nr:hypothetical protein [Longimicrobiales bacterium]
MTVRTEDGARRIGTALEKGDEGWVVRLDGEEDTPLIARARNTIEVALPDGSPIAMD